MIINVRIMRENIYFQKTNFKNAKELLKETSLF